MDFSRCIVGTQVQLSADQWKPNDVPNINTNFEIEIPNYRGYFYNIGDNAVWTTKKGPKFFGSRMKLKIYTESEYHKTRPCEEYVQLLRTSDNCRRKVYLNDIRSEVYRLMGCHNINYCNDPVILPGIIYNRK